MESQCRERVYPAEEEYECGSEREGQRGRELRGGRGRKGDYSLIRVEMREGKRDQEMKIGISKGGWKD